MTLRDAIRLAIGNLRLSPLRTILTILGLGVGVGAILTVMTLGGAGEERVEDEISRLGVDKVWIHAEEPDVPLSNKDGEKIAASASVPACAGAYTACAVSAGEKTVLAQVCGYDAGLEQVHHPSVVEGRLFTAREYAQGEAVALMDQTLAQSLGGEIIGRRVDVGSRKVRVIGVIDGMATPVMSGMSGMLLLPLETFLDTWNVQVSEVTVAVPRGMQAGDVAQEAIAALASGAGSFRATTLEEEIDAAKAVVRIFVMVLACVAAVCMLNGAIGVMNILLVSVRERQREIGLMKAIGASSGQIALLFLLEAAGYALLGGLMGLVLGAVMIRICAWWIGLEASMEGGVILPMLLGASALGMLFGTLPALRAAGMQPVEALRRE